MDQITRWILASCRLAALADARQWTKEELFDVAALATPKTPFAEWVKARGETPADMVAPAVSPAPAAPEVEDPETTASMEAILKGEANSLIRDGILSVKEIKV